jgi:hypothetical protein
MPYERPDPPPRYQPIPNYDLPNENDPLLDNNGAWDSESRRKVSACSSVFKPIISIILILFGANYIVSTMAPEWQKRAKERHEQQREQIQWGALRKDDEPCISYGTARYQAFLEYTPPAWNNYTACKETPIQIHGKDMLPNECRRTVSLMCLCFYTWC